MNIYYYIVKRESMRTMFTHNNNIADGNTFHVFALIDNINRFAGLNIYILSYILKMSDSENLLFDDTL